MASKSVTKAPLIPAIDLDEAYSAVLLIEQDARRIAGIATGIRATVEPLRKLLPLEESERAPSDDALSVLDMAAAIQQFAINTQLTAAKQAKLLSNALDARDSIAAIAP